MKILGSRKPVQPQVGWLYESQSYKMKLAKAKEWMEGRDRVKMYQQITKKEI